MAIEKGLYAAPEGIDDLLEGEMMDDELVGGEALEIEIVDPESITLSDGSMEITLIPDGNEADLMGFDANLADYMDESELQALGSDLVGDFDKDIADRRDWAETYVEGLKLLGLKYEERTEPWNGACGVFHPMLTESVVRFQSESIMETFPAAGPVKTQIIGH